MATVISHSPAETESFGEQWGCVAQSGWVIGLSGDLGAGKTQLVKGLARGLGAGDSRPFPHVCLDQPITTAAGCRSFTLTCIGSTRALKLSAQGLNPILSAGRRDGHRVG